MSTERGNQEQCIICSSNLITAVVNKQNQPNITGIKYQIRTVFVLTRLLGISNGTCCDLLQFGNPSSWLSYCFECFETVIEAEKVFSELIKLESRWTYLKKSVENKICKQKYSSQFNLSNFQNSEIIHRIRTEALNEFQSLNSKCNEDLDPPTYSDNVKIEVDEEEHFGECALPDVCDDQYHSSEKDDTLTQSNANSVPQNTKNQEPEEQDCSPIEILTPEEIENKTKNEVGRRTRSGRLTISNYCSDSNWGSISTKIGPNHDLVI